MLGYEEHQAGSKGLHMNFVFVADVERSMRQALQLGGLYRARILDEELRAAEPIPIRREKA